MLPMGRAFGKNCYMVRLILFFILLGPGGARAAGPVPEYFIAVQNWAAFEGGTQELEDSYKALAGMVKLADEQNVKLTLLFGARYAAYIASAPARLAEFEGWKKTGHEIGAYHEGPESPAWDGYTDLPAEALARLRKGAAQGAPAPGHQEFFAALDLLAPAMKAGCMQGRADEGFLKAAPAYEICGGPGRRGMAGKGTGGEGYKGINEFLGVFVSSGAVRKSLACFHPADKAGIEAAEKSFSGLPAGVYGTAFKSTPSEFGAFYAWLAFLRRVDPQGQRSRTVSVIVDAKGLPEKEAGAAPIKMKAPPPKKRKVKEAAPAEPEAAPKTELPRLKPIQSIYGKVGKLRLGPPPAGNLNQGGYCGDGTCDTLERAHPGRCPGDCGAGRAAGGNN